MASELKYARIIRAVRSMPWAIQPERLADILDVLTFQAGGGKLTQEEVREYCGLDPTAAARGGRYQVTGGGTAIIGLRGIISHRIEQVQDISGPGGTSVEGFRNRFREAMANDDVGSIIIDVDSPGGAVDGVPELAQEIYDARGRKPVVAVANTLAASAAYWLAAAADEISVTPSGDVGSVGVFAAHEDMSGWLAQRGLRMTLIHAGRYKVEGNPFEPLSDEAHAYIQHRVDAVYDDFVEAVARGRGVDEERVRTDFGEGRTVPAREALDAGMVDRIETLEQAIERVRGGGTDRQRRRAQARTPWDFSFV